MFKVTKPTPDRLDIEFRGKLDADEMKAALDDLEAKAADLEAGKMLFVVGDFQLPTMDAVMVEFSRWPTMLGFLRKFTRCAVIAEERWLRFIAQAEGAIIPGVQIKGFAPDRRGEAEAWLDGWEATVEA